VVSGAVNDPLVTTAWLAEHLADPDVQVVDATWYMPNEEGSGSQVYAAGHIPGAGDANQPLGAWQGA